MIDIQLVLSKGEKNSLISFFFIIAWDIHYKVNFHMSLMNLGKGNWSRHEAVNSPTHSRRLRKQTAAHSISGR